MRWCPKSIHGVLDHGRCSTGNWLLPSSYSLSFPLLLITLLFSFLSTEILEKEKNRRCTLQERYLNFRFGSDHRGFVTWTGVIDVGSGCLLTMIFFLLFLCRKDQNVLSPVNCWNLLLNQVKRESRDHTTLSDIYLNNIIPRFVQVSEDSGRLFKKVDSCFSTWVGQWRNFVNRRKTILVAHVKGVPLVIPYHVLMEKTILNSHSFLPFWAELIVGLGK